MESARNSNSSMTAFLPRVCRIVVILNPVSGRGTGTKLRPALEEALSRVVTESKGSKREVEWEIRETTRQGDGTCLARDVALEGVDIVAAAGGDGTIGDVVNGIVGTGARLGIVPLGTGNDFARSLGLAGNLDLAVRTLVHGTPRRIDLGRTGDRYFINAAGCGFDALVAERVNRGYRWLRGTPAYVLAMLQSLATHRAANMRITADGESLELRAMLCCVANSPGYGGGMRIAPDARIDDGALDLCILKEAGTFEFLRAFPRVFRGTHVTHPKFMTRRVTRVRIETDPPIPVLIDGEVNHMTPIEFEVVPGAIEVMSPDLKEEGGRP